MDKQYRLLWGLGILIDMTVFSGILYQTLTWKEGVGALHYMVEVVIILYLFRMLIYTGNKYNEAFIQGYIEYRNRKPLYWFQFLLCVCFGIGL